MIEHIVTTLKEAREALDALTENQEALQSVKRSAKTLVETFRSGNRVFSCGNGGSMSDAIHFAEELSRRYRIDRKALPAVAISDIGHISCVANDYGYQDVFSRYLEAHGSAGNVLLAISTSGTSANVIALTGKPGSELARQADIEIFTPPGQFADRIQELHIKVIHILIELVERSLFPENY